MKKVIVTGATGFIGSALIRRLLKENIVVYGVDVDTYKFDEFCCFDSFIKVVAEFKQYEILDELIKDRDIDVFYHFAWSGGFTEAIKDHKLQMKNAGYAGDALIAATKINCKKFVYAGTYNEYEISNFLDHEFFEPRYTCIYSTGKTAADLLCRTLAYNIGIDYCTALIPMPYGENNYSMQLVNVVLKSLLNGKPPKLVEGYNKYDLVYIDDIAGAFYSIGEKGRNQRRYYIGHRSLKTFRELFTEIRDIIAPDVELGFGEYKDNQRINYSSIDLDALYNDTGYECKSDLKETIIKTAKWVKENII